MKRVVVLLLLLPLFCIAQLPKPGSNTYVNDYANVLTVDQVYQLNVKLRHLEDATTVQVAILLIQRLPGDMSIEDYARTIGNTWKVGTDHNGIVYVAALEEHKQRLEIAEKLEGDIPDVSAANIINNLKSDLQTKDYYAAMDLLISQIGQQLHVDTMPPDSTTSPLQSLDDLPEDVLQQLKEPSEYDKAKARYDAYLPYIGFGILGGAVVFVIWAYRYRKKYVRENTINGVYIGVGSDYYASTHPGSGYDFDGSGSGGGFGGFGGGGGGGFSGGGASGSW